MQTTLKKTIPINFKEILPELSRRNRATHNIHKYPAKLIPHIPNYLINKYTNESDTVYDPFCGSGTTLLESILCNRNAIGTEINPVAQLISKVKTTPLNLEDLKKNSKKCIKLIKECKRFDIPEFPNRDIWFTKKTQADIARIKKSIDELNMNTDTRDFFHIALSAIIYKVSNAEQRDIKPRLAKRPNMLNVVTEFRHRLDYNIECMASLQTLKRKSVVTGNDAKTINLRRNVDMIITSPPYLSAMEYFRSTKLEYYWLKSGEETQYRELARRTINKELYASTNQELQPLEIFKIDQFVSSIFEKSPRVGLKASMYFSDLFLILQKMYRILTCGGYAAIIIGNSQILKKRVPLNYFVRLMGEKAGFNIAAELLDAIKTTRLMTKRSDPTNRIYNEHVLIFQK